MLQSKWIAALSGITAFLLAAMMVNHGVLNDRMHAGPGLTLDESFNIDQGVYLVDAMAQHGPLLFTPSVAQKVFGDDRYLPDHPPLGRVLLGTAHLLTAWLIPGSEGTTYNVPAARLGACVAFALTVSLLVEFARRRYGKATAITVALMLISMPNIMGHARIAALESATNLAWVAALIPLLSWWTDQKAPSSRQAMISGFLWGLLLLTKVQGVLLPPIVFLWSVWRFRESALRPLALWLTFGGVVFLACWPWLWLDPANNLWIYLGRTTQRTTLNCWYFGEKFADKDVPWHFPFVMTLISLPVWTVLALCVRPLRRAWDSVEQLLLLSIFIPLLVFSVPGTPVYDGTRLFLVVFPSIALLAGRYLTEFLQTTWLNQPVSPRRKRWKTSWLIVACGLPLWLWSTVVTVMSPLAISQYGVLAGGNRGAAWLGMEAGYWSDALNGSFWTRVPRNSTVMVAPVMHEFQLNDLESLVPIIQERNIRLIPFEYDSDKQKGLLLLIHRLADLRESLRTVPDGATIVAEVKLDGVVFARLLDTTNAAWKITP